MDLAPLFPGAFAGSNQLHLNELRFLPFKMLSRALSSLVPFAAVLSAVWPAVEASSVLPDYVRRQLPAEPLNVTTIYSPGGVQIRYKMPGKDGVCETTEGE
jgi:hypothetical protein